MTNPTTPADRAAALLRVLSPTTRRADPSSTRFSAALALATLPPPRPPSSTLPTRAATTVHAPAAAPARPATPSPAPAALRDVPYADLIDAAARRHGVDPALLAALVSAESGFKPDAHSPAGAKGLTQLMDATARRLGVTDPLDPAQSLEGGARFLGALLAQFGGDERLALAAYNAGPGAVQRYGGIPPYEETRRYVPKVLAMADAFRRTSAGALGAPSPMSEVSAPR